MWSETDTTKFGKKNLDFGAISEHGRHFISLNAVHIQFFENVEQACKSHFQNILATSQPKTLIYPS